LVPVFALLGRRQESITTTRYSDLACARTECGRRRVARLCSAVVDDPVATVLSKAASAAAVAVDEIPVVALFTGVRIAVTASGRNLD